MWDGEARSKSSFNEVELLAIKAIGCHFAKVRRMPPDLIREPK
jgi:hypothetical protein